MDFGRPRTSSWVLRPGYFVLGHSNTAGQVSKLSNPNGTALGLVSKAGTPSLRVSNTTLVPSLSADLLVGLSSTAFQKAGTVVRRSAPTHTPSEGPINSTGEPTTVAGGQATGWCTRHLRTQLSRG